MIEKVLYSPHPRRSVVHYREEDEAWLLINILTMLGSDCQMAVPPTEGKWGWLLVSHPEHLEPVDLAEAIGIPQPEEEEEPQT